MVSPVRIRVPPLLVRVPAMNRGLLLQPYCYQVGEPFVYLLRGFVLHVGQRMRVGVKSDDYISVRERLLNHLGVGATRQHQGAAGRGSGCLGVRRVKATA